MFQCVDHVMKGTGRLWKLAVKSLLAALTVDVNILKERQVWGRGRGWGVYMCLHLFDEKCPGQAVVMGGRLGVGRTRRSGAVTIEPNWYFAAPRGFCSACLFCLWSNDKECEFFLRTDSEGS